MSSITPLAREIYDSFFEDITSTPLSKHSDFLKKAIQSALFEPPHGDLHRWLQAFKLLPTIKADHITLKEDTIKFSTNTPISTININQLEKSLHALCPWRHGPFHFFGIDIETEWLSCMKWKRLKPFIQSLQNRTVLDVGCGSGYFIWRMLGEGARQVIGIDPTPLLLIQFEVAKKYADHVQAHVLPLRMEALACNSHAFDTVFSMGVLYHRKKPIEHLLQLEGALSLKTDSELVLETLVLDQGNEDTILTPNKKCYAGMPNVWKVPSIAALKKWLQIAGFSNIQVVNTCKTTSDEQRKTGWMQTHSLCDFLMSNDNQKTIEGYQAPTRAILLARR